MRLILNLTWLSLAAAATIRSPETKSYYGYKVYHVKTGRHLTQVRRALSKISHNVWETSSDHIDVAIPPHEIATFETLGLNTRLLHGDLGSSITKEAEIKSTWKRHDDSSGDWFDSYHSYDEHIQFFKDLQESFPEQSNWTSSGTSYEGRDIYGYITLLPCNWSTS
jgi:hypothetical protein